MSMRHQLVVLSALMSTLLPAVALAQAGGDPPGIAVVGQGEASARPNLVEFDVTATGTGELTGDASAKFKSSLKRLVDGLEGLKLDNLKIEPKGITFANMANVQQMMRMRGIQPDDANPVKGQVAITRPVRIRVSGVRDLSEQEIMDLFAKVLDVVQDSGASIGDVDQETLMQELYGGGNRAPNLLRFVLDDADQLRKKAQQQAFAHAKAQAQELAELSGVKLGRVLSLMVAEDRSNDQVLYRMANRYGHADVFEDRNRFQSGRLEEIPVRVTVRATFAIEGPLDGAAK